MDRKPISLSAQYGHCHVVHHRGIVEGYTQSCSVPFLAASTLQQCINMAYVFAYFFLKSATPPTYIYPIFLNFRVIFAIHYKYYLYFTLHSHMWVTYPASKQYVHSLTHSQLSKNSKLIHSLISFYYECIYWQLLLAAPVTIFDEHVNEWHPHSEVANTPRSLPCLLFPMFFLFHNQGGIICLPEKEQGSPLILDWLDWAWRPKGSNPHPLKTRDANSNHNIANICFALSKHWFVTSLKQSSRAAAFSTEPV